MKRNGIYYIKNSYWYWEDYPFETFEFIHYAPTGKYRIDETGHMQIEFIANCVHKRLLFNDVYFDRTRWIDENRIVFMPRYKEYTCNVD